MKLKKGALLSALLLFAAGKAEAAAPSIENYQLREGTAYVSLRQLTDTLGGFTLSWHQDTKTAAAESELCTYTFPTGTSTMFIDSHELPFGEILLEGGVTYVPLRAAADLFGYETHWQGKEQPILLSRRSTYSDYTEEDLYWLSRIISAESQGEPLMGQIAVGNVVLNRVESQEFPNTIKEVIFDSQYAVQFEPVSIGSIYWEPTEKSILAAKLTLQGTEVIDDALYFYAPALSEGTWITANRPYLTTIGCHKFYL